VAVLDGDVLSNLEVVHGLEDGEALADRVDADVLEGGMVEVDEDVARDAVVCAGAGGWVSCVGLGGHRGADRGRTLELVAVVGEPEVGEQAVDAVRVEGEQVEGVRRGVAVAVRGEHGRGLWWFSSQLVKVSGRARQPEPRLVVRSSSRERLVLACPHSP